MAASPAVAAPPPRRARPAAPRAPPLLVLALLGGALAPAAAARSAAALMERLARKEKAVETLAQSIEGVQVSPGACAQDVKAPSSCAANLPNPVCNVEFGFSAGCSCKGAAVDMGSYVVKRSEYVGTSEQQVKAEVCRMANVSSVFPNLFGRMIEEGDTKWIYYGSSTGVLANYPGFLWPRPDNDETDCGFTYDPTLRPWYMSASTGPKNVVLVIDKSGSMSTEDRWGSAVKAAKSVINSLTHADYVGLVFFDSYARTYKGLTTLAKALPGFRERMSNALDDVRPGGGTNFKDAFSKAFEFVDGSIAKGYSAACHTTYVLLTDGQAKSPNQELNARRAKPGADKEHFFFISIGSGANKTLLRDLSCAVDGVYSALEDPPPQYEKEESRRYEAKLAQAMAKFQRYYALQKTLCKTEGIVWSEPYTSIPDVFGPIASASAPVYDKSRGEPWHMVGVAATDATVCDLYEAAPDPPPPVWPSTTVGGCTCAREFKYKGKTYSGCTMDDWSVPWCATEDCGACNTASISTQCWDDCSPSGAKAQVEDELLRRANKDCCDSKLNNCALEVLRGDEGSCSASTCDDEEERKKYEWAVFGNSRVTTFSDADWVAPGYYDSASRPADSPYNDESKDCACNSTLMKPSCVCTYVAEARARAAGSSSGKKKDDGAAGAVIGIVVGVLLLALCGAAAFLRLKNSRRNQAAQQQHVSRPGPIQMAAPAQPTPYYQPTQASYPQGVAMGMPVQAPSAPPYMPPPSYNQAMYGQQAQPSYGGGSYAGSSAGGPTKM